MARLMTVWTRKGTRGWRNPDDRWPQPLPVAREVLNAVGEAAVTAHCRDVLHCSWEEMIVDRSQPRRAADDSDFRVGAALPKAMEDLSSFAAIAGLCGLPSAGATMVAGQLKEVFCTLPSGHSDQVAHEVIVAGHHLIWWAGQPAEVLKAPARYGAKE